MCQRLACARCGLFYPSKSKLCAMYGGKLGVVHVVGLEYIGYRERPARVVVLPKSSSVLPCFVCLGRVSNSWFLWSLNSRASIPCAQMRTRTQPNPSFKYLLIIDIGSGPSVSQCGAHATRVPRLETTRSTLCVWGLQQGLLSGFIW